jgi:ribose/xylose/arabinose/galactoside ABC-type transport system permease subunit
VILMGAIGPALTFLGVGAYWEKAIQGAIILAAIVIDALGVHLDNQVSRTGGNGLVTTHP